MEIGWISLHRKFKDNWLWKENRVFSKAEAWIDILLRANHKDAKILLGNELIIVNRGSFITSEVKLMKCWKWSKSKLRSFLLLLERDGMIIKLSDTKKTTLTVVNYKDYQVLETAKKPRKDYKKTAKELQKDTNNNDNNTNNINKRKEEFKNSLRSFISISYDKILMTEFFEYWSEHGVNDKKMRWEKEKSFSIERRLKTWKIKSVEFKNKGKL